MLSVKAKVCNGRLVVDEPTDLPEGSELKLVVVPEDDEPLDEEQRAIIDAALERSWKQAQEGKLVDGEAVVAELLSRHK